MRLRTKFGYIALLLACCLASYRLGVFVTMDVLKQNSTDIQAMFAFNHAKSFTSIQECLEVGSVEGSRQLVDNFLITERELLASHLGKGVSSEMIDYIEPRSEVNLDVLKGYESNRGGSWEVPNC